MPNAALEYAVYTVYFLVGPGMWGLYAIGMYQAQKRMDLVKRPRDPVPQPPPPITILIPAKDEEERIRDCLHSALGQDYSNFQVIAIDDRSNDRTGAVMDEMAARNARLSIVHIPHGDLPPGWTGKCHALYQGAQRATGKWLLFVDSDVILDPDALSATLGVAAKKDFGLLSLLPRMESRTIWEGMLVPLAGAAVAALFTAALNNNNQLPNTAFANGQFMLMRRDAYDAVGGHEAVRDQYCEDMVLARLFKRNGHRPRVSWGTDLCSVRMYDSFAKIMRGWSRIFYASAVGSPWRSILGIVFLIVCCYSDAAAFGWGIYRHIHPIDALRGYGWMITALVHWALMTGQVAIMYRWTLNPRRYALLFPVTAILLLVIFARAVWMCLTKRVEWRGTVYHHAMDHGVVSGG
ncbi:MAG: glycosyltransferase family 2 protein [Tepidisphaeraceae bacterium]|jgi:glycosyltransferase involved in cell wall biosynthesis